ncbi:MAG: glycosyltransferase family 39 protein [Candidatus Omnitrophica bacterium]|nr:glycosyltransferase family 39 protein [Candidatus Omnitrophota bacterium]
MSKPVNLLSVRALARSIASHAAVQALLFFLGVLLFKLPIINQPYYLDAISFNIPGALFIYCNRCIPLLGPFDAGHPPFVHETLAFVWAVFSYSRWISHLVIIIFSFLGVYFTYLVGVLLMDRKTGVIAALFLFFSPLYFAQSGIVNLSIPLTALAVMTVYFALEKKTPWYLFCGSCLVLTKAPGLVVIFSILLYVLSTGYRLPKKVLVEKLLIYAIPIAVFAVWLTYHQWATGWLFVPRRYAYRIGDIMPLLQNRMKILFVGNYRFFLSGMTLTLLFLNRLRDKEIHAVYPFLYSLFFSLAVLVLGIGGGNLFALFLIPYLITVVHLVSKKKQFLLPFTVIFLSLFSLSFHIELLPRYVLIAYPFYYLVGAYSLVVLFEKRKYVIPVATALFTALLITNWYGLYNTPHMLETPNSGPVLESNMEYLDVVKTHAAACNFIEKYYPQSTVYTNWPQAYELTRPEMGYVTRPLHVVDADTIGEDYKKKIDLIYFSYQSSYHSLRMRKLITEELNTRLVRSFRSNGKSAEVYEVMKR